ncbi:MAG: hypothetical protein J7K40_09335 [candidate division Zixibacteria bacterium]|nr:hypothetical protein [candidate division Zixibacteria bacterium]
MDTIIIDGAVITGYVDETENGSLTINDDYIIFPDREAAGQAARDYWEDMARNDPEELTCMVGKETLVAWALNQYAGPGETQVRNLEEWLDLWLDVPEEHFARYDGIELGNIRMNKKFGFDTIYAVAYRIE